MEEKVYSRSVNKLNLTAHVVDKKDLRRLFTNRELQGVMDIDNWVQCDLCKRWRMLPPQVDVENLPDKWFCSMNVYDKPRSNCDAVERDAAFYDKLFHQESSNGEANQQQSDLEPEKTSHDIMKKTQRDVILQQLLADFESTTSNRKKRKSKMSLISKYYFHDSLVGERVQ